MWNDVLHYIGSEPQEAHSTNGVPTCTAKRATWEQVFSRLNELRSLQNDWDGQGALAPEEANIDAAAHWLSGLRSVIQAPDQIIPGMGGEIYLNWQRSGSNVIAEIAVPTTLEWIIEVS